jgi:peroxiredoxin
MLTTANNKYPFFDLLEIVPDIDLSIKAYKPLKPVKAGNIIPDFTLSKEYSRWQHFYNGAPGYGTILLKQLLSKPLVISFYSHYWKENGLEQLKQLNAIQYEIKANGGNLLIINAHKGDEQLAAYAWEHSLSLNFYHDNNNELAKKFRVYSEDDPAWNRFSGIDVNVPLLATYVIDPSKQIIYDHFDRDFLRIFSDRDIISAVYESALIRNSRKSA